MTNLEKDMNSLLCDMRNEQALDKYYKYIKLKKNIIFCNDENTIIQKEKNTILSKQAQKEKIIKQELEIFDSFDIPFIGMKGPFLKSEYYESIPRVYNDLDLLVESINVSEFYNLLRKNGYQIKKKTYYDGPVIFMKFIPETYMNNTQTLMLINKTNNISIDLHCNLNITNAHFTKSTSIFSTKNLFDNSISYSTYKNIRQFEIHDNICFNIRHLLKHHIFYGKTQTGFKTMLQHLMDIAVMFNSDEFSEDEFIYKVSKYNIIPEALFCIYLYNKVFISSRHIDDSKLKFLFQSQKTECHWLPVLDVVSSMKASDIMIGNFEKYFPKEYKCVEFCQNINIYNINWAIQALLLNPIIIKRISESRNIERKRD